jgi:hypothetical protein
LLNIYAHNMIKTISFIYNILVSENSIQSNFNENNAIHVYGMTYALKKQKSFIFDNCDNRPLKCAQMVTV